MVPDRQKVRTEWTDGQRQNYIPPTLSGDNKKYAFKELTISGGIFILGTKLLLE